MSPNSARGRRQLGSGDSDHGSADDDVGSNNAAAVAPAAGVGGRRGATTMSGCQRNNDTGAAAPAAVGATIAESTTTKLKAKKQKKKVSAAAVGDSIQQWIPDYLVHLVQPYYGDFCYTPIFHPKLITQLMAEGFLPIATEGVLLPKLHRERCVVLLPDRLHVSKSTRKKARRFYVTINQRFDGVVDGCREQHGSHCWLYPPLVEAFRAMHYKSFPSAQQRQHQQQRMQQQDSDNDEDENVAMVSVSCPTSSSSSPTTSSRRLQARQQQVRCPVRLYSIEIWDASSEQLVGGELGYTVGSIYTSLTGFSKQDSAGSVQLAALGRLLCRRGFTLWDLGMDMEYKRGLGSNIMPRQEFVRVVRQVRYDHRDRRLPTIPCERKWNARGVIDDTGVPETIAATTRATDANGQSQQHPLHLQPQRENGSAEESPPCKKKARPATTAGNSSS